MKKILLLSTILSSCASFQPPEKIHPRFYPLDSSRGSLYRSNDNSEISCKDKKADDYVAVSYKDLAKIYEQYVLNCKEYRSPEELQRLLDAMRSLGNIQSKF